MSVEATKYTKNLIDVAMLKNEDKKFLLDFFQRKNNYKLLTTKNYIQLSKGGRRFRHSDKTNAYEEIKELPLGLDNWFEYLTTSTQNEINYYCYCRSLGDTAFHSENIHKMVSEEVSTVSNDSSLERFNAKVEYEFSKALQNFEDDLIDFENWTLIESALTSIWYGKKVASTNKIINSLLYYAIKENQEEMVYYDLNGNIVLNEEYLVPYFHEDVLVKPLPQTTEEKAYKSMHRSKSVFEGLALANADKFKYFITLTFAEVENKEKHLLNNSKRKAGEKDIEFIYVDPKNYKECYSKLNDFLSSLKRASKSKKKSFDLYFLGVPELTESGNTHFHFLMSEVPDELIFNNPKWLASDYLNNKYDIESLGIKYWNFGKSDVKLINSKSRVTSYLKKYMLKSISDSDYLENLGRNRYYASRNLEKPVVKYVDYFNEADYSLYSKYEETIIDGFDRSKIKKTTYQINKLNDTDVLLNE